MKNFSIRLLTVLFVFIKLYAFGQVNLNLEKEKVKYQYDKRRTEGSYSLSTVIGKSMQVNFDCCFDDSVHIYINNILEEKVFLKTDGSTSFTGHALIVTFNPKDKKSTLKIILPYKKVFCEIDLDKKYKMLHVNRMEHWDKTWWITFRNFGIAYE